jgi:hypothetical protein
LNCEERRRFQPLGGTGAEGSAYSSEVARLTDPRLDVADIMNDRLAVAGAPSKASRLELELCDTVNPLRV